MHAAITGAATGIGAETVARLRAAGHQITAFDIVEPAGVDHWIAVDMSDPAAIDAAAAEVSGPFDCLINNAGLPPRAGQAAKVLAVNYTGLVRMTRALLPKLAKGGSIVNTSSRAGMAWQENIAQVKALMAVDDIAALGAFVAEHGIDDTRAYNLSKEAVIVWGMAETERLLTRDLRVNAVSPAAVSTGILDDFGAAFGDRMKQNVARIGRPGQPGEIAELIVFLASPQSGWIRGAEIRIDGGMTAVLASDQLGLVPPG